MIMIMIMIIMVIIIQGSIPFGGNKATLGRVELDLNQIDMKAVEIHQMSKKSDRIGKNFP